MLGTAGFVAGVIAARRRPQEYPTPEALVTEPPVDAQVLRRDNGDLELQWRDQARSVRIYAGTTPQTIDRQTVLAHASGVGSVTLRGLDPSRRYYFELAFDGAALDGERLLVAERVVPLEGAVNFRDLGGYRTASGQRTRWGRLFRSGSLTGLTSGDHERLAAMGIRLVCDLRSNEEIQEDPDNLPETLPIHYTHLPVFNRSEPSKASQLRVLLFDKKQLEAVMLNTYTRVLIDDNAALFGTVLRQLANERSLPAVIHCTAGKDRAGVTSALVLALLDVPEAVILADYTLSNRYYFSFRQYAAKVVKPFAVFGVRPDDLYPLLVANPANLQATFDYIRQHYGSVRAYLRDMAGIDDALVEQVRRNLLEA